MFVQSCPQIVPIKSHCHFSLPTVVLCPRKVPRAIHTIKHSPLVQPSPNKSPHQRSKSQRQSTLANTFLSTSTLITAVPFKQSNPLQQPSTNFNLYRKKQSFVSAHFQRQSELNNTVLCTIQFPLKVHLTNIVIYPVTVYDLQHNILLASNLHQQSILGNTVLCTSTVRIF